MLEGATFICSTNYPQVYRRHDANIQLSYHSGRRQVLCRRDERLMVQNTQIDSRTKTKDPEKTVIIHREMFTLQTWAKRPISDEEAIL